MSPILFGLNDDPTRIFEFNPASNTFEDVTPPDFDDIFNNNFDFRNASEFRMLLLPTGQVLVSSLNIDENTLFGGEELIYTPDGGPLEIWRPTIQKITDNGNGSVHADGDEPERRFRRHTDGGRCAGGDELSAAKDERLRAGTSCMPGRSIGAARGCRRGARSTRFSSCCRAGLGLKDFNNYTIVVNGIPSQPLQFFPVQPQTVSGFVFNDVDGDTFFTTGVDTMMRNVFVFVDLNGDGKLSVLEPSTTTNAFGQWTFPNVKVGNSMIRVLPPIGGQVTTPASARPAPMRTW